MVISDTTNMKKVLEVHVYCCMCVMGKVYSLLVRGVIQE